MGRGINKRRKHLFLSKRKGFRVRWANSEKLLFLGTPQPQLSGEIIDQTLQQFVKMHSRRCLIVAITCIAICTSCRKKHAERLSAFGIQISDKGTRDQTAAAAGKDSQSFVELTVAFFVTHFVLSISNICGFPGRSMRGAECTCSSGANNSIQAATDTWVAAYLQPMLDSRNFSGHHVSGRW